MPITCPSFPIISDRRLDRRILGSTLKGTNIPNVRLITKVACTFAIHKPFFSVENCGYQFNRGVNFQMKQVIKAADVLDAFNGYIRTD